MPLKTYEDYYVVAAYGGGTALRAYSNSIGSDEMFDLIDLESGN